MYSYPQFNEKPLRETIHEALSNTPIKGVLQGKRKLTKGLSGKRIVFFPSNKNKALMPCESRLEADNCLNLEFDSTVTSYRTQPFTINLGHKYSYTPDTVHIDDIGNLIVREVKFSGALKKDALIDRLNSLKILFIRSGIQFQVLTENNLQSAPLINNYKFLYRCSHQKCNEKQISYALKLFKELPSPCVLKDFRQYCNKSNLPPLIADTLLFLGLILFDKNLELTPDSYIWTDGGAS